MALFRLESTSRAFSEFPKVVAIRTRPAEAAATIISLKHQTPLRRSRSGSVLIATYFSRPSKDGSGTNLTSLAISHLRNRTFGEMTVLSDALSRESVSYDRPQRKGHVEDPVA